MATFVAIRNKKQTRAAMLGTLRYILQEKKISRDGLLYASGQDCTAATSYLEMMTTKQSYGKTDGRQYFHFVQSFSDEDTLMPGEANQIGLEFAARQFPGYEVVVATHCDTGHLHNHFLVNSVSWQNGKKLHQTPESLREHRQVNDQICLAHDLHVLEPQEKRQKKKRMKPGEYQAALRGESWKFTLIKAIEEALELSLTREDFIANMEYEGYSVCWTDSHKYITYTTPEGRKCRDRSLHDDTYLKENLEKLFVYRQETGFIPGSQEPPQGWLCAITEVASDAVRLGRSLEQLDTPAQLPTAHAMTDSRQRQREKLKKLAQGHKLQSEQEQEQTQTI